MTLIILIVSGIILIFGAVLFFGPPFVPTLSKQMTTALDLLDLKPGQTLIELGSGDGRVAQAAAERGLKVVGYELNPFLVIISRIRCRKYGKQVKIVWDDLWKAAWPEADGVFTFMLQRQMQRLDQRIEHWRHNRPVRLASFAFYIPDRAPASKYNGIFLYEYGMSQNKITAQKKTSKKH